MNYHPYFISLMKYFIIPLVILFCLGCGRKENPRSHSNTLKGTISISGAFALYPITVKWAEEFRKIHPKIRIDISAGGAGKGMADALSGIVDLGMFSREILPAEKQRGIWWIAVSRDAVLPTISSRNPVLHIIKQRGLTQAEFANIFLHQNNGTWEGLVSQKGESKIHAYTRSDACGAAGIWAAYLGGTQESLKGLGIFGDPGLAEAIKKDPLGIGYNNTIYIYDLKTRSKYPGLEVIPIDINENGQIDPEESFYNSIDEIMAAISGGKYPSPPARELYFVAGEKPRSPAVIAFLKWILTDGQHMVSEAGYVPLKNEIIHTELKKLE